ncbi:MAG: DUF1559 domain-containing protein [Armatimonadetes bacterium]|nr:DUF1559 domain-containing protein [Armatimonadota bacterium]
MIAILAAILFPVFARAREKARQASCLSNVKQLMLAVNMYQSDYDGFFPYSTNYAPWGTWYTYFLAPYIKNDQMIRCPSNPTWPTGYAYNIQFGYFPGRQISPPRTGAMYDGVHEAKVSSPAERIVICDGTLGYYWMRNVLAYTDSQAVGLCWRFFPQTTRATMESMYNWPDAGLHNGGINCGFADGHAKWMGLSQVLEPTLWFP